MWDLLSQISLVDISREALIPWPNIHWHKM